MRFKIEDYIFVRYMKFLYGKLKKLNGKQPKSCTCVQQRLTSSCAVMLQLVTVHCLFAVCSFPEEDMNIERRETTG